MITEYVQLVDENDQETGVMEKIAAHREAKLHRAISVFIFNSKGEILLQRRAESKYHSPLLWTNSCCTHPRPQEPLLAAAKRRLVEEMGVKSDLKFEFSFVYKATFDNGLTEHEFDHVFFGITDEKPIINKEEVAEYQYLSLPEIKAWMEHEPQQFTEWFKIVFDTIIEKRK